MLSALWHSTSASGPSRRVPPPRGLPPRQSISDNPFFLLYLFGFPLVRGVSSRRGAPPADPRSSGSAFPTRTSTTSFSCSSMRAMYMYRGGRMCFPVRDSGDFMHRIAYVITLDPFVPRSRLAPGRPDVFSRSRLTTTSSPLLSSPTLLLVTSSRSTGRFLWTRFLGWFW